MEQRFVFILLRIYAVYDLFFLVTDQFVPPSKEDYIKLTVEQVLVLTAARRNSALAMLPLLGEAVICHSNLLKHTWNMSHNFALISVALFSAKSQLGSSSFARTALSEKSHMTAAKSLVFKLLLLPAHGLKTDCHMATFCTAISL